MDHQDVTTALADPVAQDLMSSPLVARLAYLGTDGGPRVVPVAYLFDGTQFLVFTATIAPKVAALRANPAVALTIDTDPAAPRVLLVRGTATVDIVDGVPQDYLAAVERSQGEQYSPEFEGVARALYPQMARIAITPTWAKVLDFQTRLPEAVATLAARAQG